LGEKNYNDQLKVRLNKAEALVLSLGTPKSIKRRRTAVDQEHNEDGSD
jgi:hypothetical protein